MIMHTWLRFEKEAMFCCRKSKKTNHLHQEQGVQILETQLCNGHKDSTEHKDAVNEEAIRDRFSNCFFFLLPCLPACVFA